MPATSRRRIVRRTVMALAVVVLLPVWYVAAWLAVSRAAGDGLISRRTVQSVHVYQLPLYEYADADNFSGYVCKIVLGRAADSGDWAARTGRNV
jgi:hypothetical protein